MGMYSLLWYRRRQAASLHSASEFFLQWRTPIRSNSRTSLGNRSDVYYAALSRESKSVGGMDRDGCKGVDGGGSEGRDGDVGDGGNGGGGGGRNGDGGEGWDGDGGEGGDGDGGGDRDREDGACSAAQMVS